MFDFPSSPTNGQIFTPITGLTYTWDAADGAWRLSGGTTGSGSGLDADLLDGRDSPYYLDLGNSTGTLPTANHGNQPGGTLHASATPSTAGFMTDAPSDGLTYGRKGSSWATVVGGAWTDDAPPAPPLLDGQLWFKASTGVMYVYYDDGTSQQWVQVSASPQSPNQGFAIATAQSRNLIVNPALAITQENGTTAGTVTGYYVADQWKTNFSGTGFAVSANVSYTNINPSGSPGRISFKTTTAKASLAAGEYAAFNTTLEGARAYPLFYAGNAPLQAVLRFGFNGPAGTYSVSIRNVPAYTVIWTGQFTIAAGQANTDTYQTLVIPSPPTGYAWGGGGSAQIEIWFTFAAGTTFIAPANGWQAGQFLAGPGQFNLLGTVNNQAQIWDIGLHADPNKTGLAPAFQVPDYGHDLLECQRYWWKINNGSTAYPRNSTDGYRFVKHIFPTSMRVSPTMVAQGLLNYAGGQLGMTNNGGNYTEFEFYYDTGAVGNNFLCNTFIANARM